VSTPVEQNSAATQKVSASAEQMSAQVEEVVASSQTLSDMAKELQVVQKGLVRRGVGTGKVLLA